MRSSFRRKVESLDDIFAFAAKFESDSGLDDSESYFLDLTLEELFTNLVRHAPGKDDIEIEKSLESGLPKCYGDAHLVEQVLLNLINNAAKAMGKNQTAKRIQIASYCKDERLFIQVSDSGPGIPKELRDKVFDPFFTTHNDGSGIGLSIAQRIVADHNGTIEILSSKWGGATLSVELPIEKRGHST